MKAHKKHIQIAGLSMGKRAKNKWRSVTLLIIGASLLSVEARAGCTPMPDGKPRYAVNGPEVSDRKTGFVWQRCSLGFVYDAAKGCTGEPVFFTLDEAEAAAREKGNGWHVPSGPELQSIVDIACGSPATDMSAFPDIAADSEGEANYWTTNAVGMADLFYCFDFVTGRADGHTRGIPLSVRLVRKPAP